MKREHGILINENEGDRFLTCGKPRFQKFGARNTENSLNMDWVGGLDWYLNFDLNDMHFHQISHSFFI